MGTIGTIAFMQDALFVLTAHGIMSPAVVTVTRLVHRYAGKCIRMYMMHMT